MMRVSFLVVLSSRNDITIAGANTRLELLGALAR
jgi:hypothetical protein